MGIKVLVVGSGGREHALGWKLKQSPRVSEIYFAPGNGGTELIGKNIAIDAPDIRALVKFAQKEDIDLTIVGPEEPLANGIVDLFDNQNLTIFGPTMLAARLESNKAWANNFMRRYKIPCPKFKIFLNPYEAMKFINSASWDGFAIKASGLAGGKGVLISNSRQEAVNAIKKIMLDRIFGAAGEKVVIQEKISGLEVSVIAFCDGKTAVPLLPSQDHKPVLDNDKGPNTGGMGAYAPVPFVTEDVLDEIHKTILQPAVDGMLEEGCPFVGILYAGLMLTDNGTQVLEFNVRFGDPETQPQIVLLRSDLVDIVEACMEGRLRKDDVLFNNGAAVCVVLASGGYPGHYATGKVIRGIDTKAGKSCSARNIHIFHAGTAIKSDKIITTGGRVLGITALASTLEKAIKKTYSVILNNNIFFDNMHFRKDIGTKALEKIPEIPLFRLKRTSKLKIVILISGGGTTMESILKACWNKRLANVKPLLVISSNADAGGLVRAEKFGVPTKVINPRNYQNSLQFGEALLKEIAACNPDLISQNGWLPLTPINLIENYKERIINQHPAPLDPEHKNGEHYDFGGKGMYGIIPHAAILYFRKLIQTNKPRWQAKRYIPTEATVHFVTQNYDEGDVIRRTKMDIDDNDTPKSIQQKLLPIEHETVLLAIEDFAKGQVEVQKRPKPLVRVGEERFLYKAKQKAIKEYLHRSL